MKMHGNNIMNEQTQFKSHILLEHITQQTHNMIFHTTALSPKKGQIVLIVAASDEVHNVSENQLRQRGKNLKKF